MCELIYQDTLGPRRARPHSKMSSGSDALSQEIRDAIRAKHRLVEKMKESVVEASDRPRDQKKKAGISFGAFAHFAFPRCIANALGMLLAFLAVSSSLTSRSIAAFFSIVATSYPSAS